jgi:riboflavin kinase/FMN adenylyltransferase
LLALIFVFGKGRAGTTTDLVKFGQEMGFDVTIAPLIEDASIQISSTAIRNALSDGRPARCSAQLGHWHRIEGEVIGR